MRVQQAGTSERQTATQPLARSARHMIAHPLEHDMQLARHLLIGQMNEPGCFRSARREGAHLAEGPPEQALGDRPGMGDVHDYADGRGIRDEARVDHLPLGWDALDDARHPQQQGLSTFLGWVDGEEALEDAKHVGPRAVDGQVHVLPRLLEGRVLLAQERQRVGQVVLHMGTAIEYTGRLLQSPPRVGRVDRDDARETKTVEPVLADLDDDERVADHLAPISQDLDVQTADDLLRPHHFLGRQHRPPAGRSRDHFPPQRVLSVLSPKFGN